ncbi:TlpA family protein disulfide reductase [Myroides pelagicus]|uniref:Thioredoxin domain-containing protein n=1 Tax=Myroides pelagicus TaxID=270914 RepID=A0A7K1GNK0_9FLAO|nr:hypothetical protein [Myroides pelagicus]MEC4114703.1 hypothetical protein [Myroides pelagicus]MTH30457.1 hypothetical protein [Myroides pelagicus]
MNIQSIDKQLLLPILILFTLASCSKKFEESDYSAYFQGEIFNPNSDYVLFCKDNNVLDTLYLDKNNKFFHHFDSITPGMYIYRHKPEYQYIYIDKNDSLNVRLNTKDFDHSVTFSGRGAEKNNFLMALNMKNLVDENAKYENYDLGPKDFLRKLDSTHAARTTYYLRSKTMINWSNDFDSYAKAKLDLYFFSQKEIYPIAHYIRTKQDIRQELPKDYYSFRKKVDYNDERMISFSSYTRYLSIMLNATTNETEIEFDAENKFDKNIEKLNIVDTLIANKKVKNAILDNIAFVYLLEDQNLNNNDKFLDRYFELSTDSTQHSELIKIQEAVQNLKYEKRLPNVPLVNIKGKSIHINRIISKPTLMFVWTKNSLGHADGAHRRAIQLLENTPDVQVISVCIDGEHEEWVDFVNKYNHPNLIELRCTDFNQMKDQWIITKIQRSFVLNSDGTIRNAFVNIFDKNIDHLLLTKEEE